MMFSAKIIRFFISVFSIILLFSLFSCKGKKDTPNSKWAQYIKGHTSGQISKNSSIKVIFNNDLIDPDEVGTDASDLIKFSPSIKGEAEWASTNEIVFVPKNSLPSDKEYKATLNLSDYIKMEKVIGKFFFYFSTIKQDFDIDFIGLKFPSLTNLSEQAFHGNLNTADIASVDAVESILTASQDEKDLKISWEHSGSNSHSFIIKGIKRKKENSMVLLKWNGKSLDVNKKGEREIEVPARGIFEVSTAEAIVSEEKFISISFTDPLLQNQNLKGLVHIKGIESRTVIDGNIIRLYPLKDVFGDVELYVEKGVRNSESKRLKNRFFSKLTFQKIDPGVRFASDGTIIPDMDSLTVPFEAVNVHSVQVTVLKVYTKNMGQFFQTNNIKQSNQIKRVGRYLWRKTISLNATPEKIGKWTRYSLDISELYKKYPNSLFQIELSINRSNSVFKCDDNPDPVVKEPDFKNLDDNDARESSSWDYAENYYYDEYNSEWENRKNPCFDAYYNKRYGNPVSSTKNFIASNIGVIAKYGSGKNIKIITTDILSAFPISADINVYNYQNHLLGSGKTGKDGFGDVKISKEGKPFYLVAEYDGNKGFLKLNGESALPTSHFDVGGQIIQDGIKGYIYGERGVWRPGDEIFLTFVLEDKDDLLPENHPLQIELFNPHGQLKQTVTNYKKVDDFYSFVMKTDEDDITGTWTAKIRLGNLIFSKELKIETIVPNRLKVELSFKEKVLHSSMFPVQANIFSQWLHGASAGGLQTQLFVNLVPRKTSFSRFSDYIFDDMTRSYQSYRTEVSDAYLDENGKHSFPMNISAGENSPGMLTAVFSTRVYEASGNFSVESFSIPFHPYSNYVGIKTPKGDKARGMLLTDTQHEVTVATVDSKGKPVSLDNVEVVLYKINWRWWWEKSGESLANFTSASSTNEIARDTISTKRGIGKWKFMVKYPEWGRYLIRVEDKNGGHAASKIIYIDWPGWAGRAREEKGVGATRLNFTADKEKYKVGETAKIFLPETQKGRALVSVENGKKILSQMWIDTKKGNNRIEIPVTAEMAPNAYINVSLIQPFKNKNNDAPLRLYGVIPIFVENPDIELHPVLSAPKEIKPVEKTRITVSEKNKKEMTYTIAIVDEGLLGLTRFTTPDLKDYFYQREALGVKTWDLFDDVIGAYGGELNRILALGGGEEGSDKTQMKENRFPPIVEFLGPFHLKKGEKAEHSFQLKPYIGSVKIMVIAGSKGAYGSTDQSVFVRQPLMLTATLPRVLGPQEDLVIPVSVFSNSKSIRNATVTIDGGKNIKIMDSKNKSVRFPQPGEKLVYFKAKVSGVVGKSKVVVTAKNGRNVAKQEINIDIRSSNPVETNVTNYVIKPGQKWSSSIMPVGALNTNNATVELSTMPPLNIEDRVDYLIRYPHGCLEQTVSSVFPQLFLNSLVQLEDDKKSKIEKNIKAAIKKIRKFQLSSGQFTYWPGQIYNINSWTDIYAGHFLIEAEKKGYHVPSSMLLAWQKNQYSTANAWKSDERHSVLTQAYRMYVLALSNKPSMTAMNRLRESGNLDATSRKLLAAAFFLAGQKDAALKLMSNNSSSIFSYSQPGVTFGSKLRDNSIIVMSLVDMDKQADAKKYVDYIAKNLSSKQYFSTQSTAFSLLAMSKFIGESEVSRSFKYNIKIGNKKEKIKSTRAISINEIANVSSTGTKVEIENLERKTTLYLTIANKGAPLPGKEKTLKSGLFISSRYAGLNDGYVDFKNIKQGADFTAIIDVKNNTNTRLESLALTQIFPSGWQIHNARFESGQIEKNAEFQDFRDDRVYTYFSLNPGETKNFEIILNASFLGKYYLPGITVEDMYEPGLKSSLRGMWINVVK